MNLDQEKAFFLFNNLEYLMTDDLTKRLLLNNNESCTSDNHVITLKSLHKIWLGLQIFILNKLALTLSLKSKINYNWFTMMFDQFVVINYCFFFKLLLCSVWSKCSKKPKNITKTLEVRHDPNKLQNKIGSRIQKRKH